MAGGFPTAMDILGPYTPLILLIFVASMLIQAALTRSYRKWSGVRNARNLTGAQVARMMLDENGLTHVPVNAGLPGSETGISAGQTPALDSPGTPSPPGPAIQLSFSRL